MAETPTIPTPVPLVIEVEAYLHDLDHRDQAPVPVSTGFDTLDLLMDGGTVPGDLVYLGGHSSVGKTTFALQWAMTWAERHESAVFVVSQEMTLRGLTRRLLAQHAQVPPGALKRYDVTPDQARRLVGLLKRWANLPLLMTEEAVSIGLIEAMLWAWAYPDPVGLLVVDYLQLTDAPVGVHGAERFIEVSRRLKRLAKALKLTVLAISATVPPANASLAAEANLYSLYGGRLLTNDADVILNLKRDKGARTGTLEAEKVRDGQPGTVQVLFRSDILAFEELPR